MRPALRDSCWLALLVVSLFPWPLSAEVRGETRHVLVLLSSERPVAPQSGFADALVRELIRASRDPIQFVEISVQPARAVPGGIGLVAIRERLKLVNGDSVIVSGPGEGTRVEAWVPLSLP